MTLNSFKKNISGVALLAAGLLLSNTVLAETNAIKIVAGEQAIYATLTDSAATRDFLAQLPLGVTLSDYHRTEKIAYLPKALSTEDMPKAMDPEVGDFTYFAPWGNIALFYKDFGYSRGLVKLGEIAPEDIETLKALPEMNVTIERSQPEKAFQGIKRFVVIQTMSSSSN